MTDERNVMKESDIRPPDLMDELKNYLNNDRKRWLAGQDKFVRIACPACGSKKATGQEVIRGMAFETCSRCETVFHNPRPSRQQLRAYYDGAESYKYWSEHIFPKSEVSRREKIFRPLADMVQSVIAEHQKKSGTLVEMGAGFGLFCEEMAKKKVFKRIIAVEPVSELADRCRDKKLEVLESYFEDVDLPEASVDCIVTFEVIEHVFSPSELIKKCRALLVRNGLLVLKSPNVMGFDFMVLGKQKAPNFGLEHMNMFHPESIRRLLETRGFKVLDVKTPGKLDAEIVRNQALKGNFNIQQHPFLKRILIDEWDRLGEVFQQFISHNRLSSSMLVTAVKK